MSSKGIIQIAADKGGRRSLFAHYVRRVFNFDKTGSIFLAGSYLVKAATEKKSITKLWAEPPPILKLVE